MKIKVIVDDQILKIDVGEQAVINDIKDIVARQTLLPLERQILFLLVGEEKLVLDPATQVSTLDQHTIYVEEVAPPTEEELRELEHKLLCTAVAACQANATEDLSNAVQQYKELLSASPEDTAQFLNTLLDSKWACIHYATYEGRVEVLQQLLDYGANPNMPNSDEWTPLQLAVCAGAAPVVSLLLEQPFLQIDKFTPGIGTALHLACMHDRLEIVRLLLDKEANVFIEHSQGSIAIELTSNEAIKQLILQCTVPPDLETHPASFSGVVTCANPYSMNDSQVFLVLNTDTGLFCHYRWRDDFINEEQPVFKTPIVNITSARTYNQGSRSFFLVEGRTWSLKYYTPFEDMSEVWTTMILEAVRFFQRYLNNRLRGKERYSDYVSRDSLIDPRISLLSEEEFEVSLESFDVLQEFGQGYFGTITLVQKKNTGLLYYLTTLNKLTLQKAQRLKTLMNEYKQLKNVKHPFINELYWAFQSKTKMFLVFAHSPLGTVAEWLQQVTRFSEESAKFFLQELVLAVERVHQAGLLVKNIALSRLLIDNDGDLKLNDFLLDHISSEESTYITPEFLRHSGTTAATDIYMLGAAFYEMLTGSRPFYTSQISVFYYNIANQDLEFPEYVSEAAQHLIRDLLQRTPEDRPSLEAVKAHPYFADVDWDAVLRRATQSPININELHALRNHSN